MSDGIPPPPPPPPPPPLQVAPPPPPPPPPSLGGSQQSLLSSNGKSASKTKYRRLLWKKIPDNQIHKAENIWSKKQNPEQSTKIKPDFEIIHELFSVKESSTKMPSRRSPSPRPPSEAGGYGTYTLLDSKRSLNVNIYLRQFKKSVSEVLKAVEDCDTSFMSGEQLQSLLKLLPEGEEKKTLSGFKDDISTLDNADKFLVGLLAIPSYTLRIECTLMRNTFTNTIMQIEESLKYLHLAMKEIRECRALPAILHLVLQAGNYLNQGLSYGNASGFRLQSLRVLVDTKANKPGITMMHYVAMELEKQHESMMTWPNQLPTLSKVCKISDSEVYAELTTLTKDVTALRKRIEKDDGVELKEKMIGFMEMSEKHLNLLNEEKSKLSEYTKEFALYLCEQPSQFSLEECFNTVAEFQDKFEKAARDNKRKDKLKAKRERNKNLSSRSFSGINQETATATAVESSSKRRNTLDTPRQSDSVRGLRCMSESCIEEQTSNVLPTSHKRSRSDKLDVKVTRVTLTKLDPLRRTDTHNSDQDDSWSGNFEQSDPKMAWIDEQDGKLRNDSGSNDSTSSLAEALRRESKYGRRRVNSREDYFRPSTQRRFRSLRAGLWESESDFTNTGLRDRREYSQSVESLGSLKSENRREKTSPTDRETTGNVESNDEISSSRQRFLLRRAYARSSTDLGLSPDTYVTNSGEILKMSAGETKQRPRSMDATTAMNWSVDIDDQPRSRNDDIREKIRRYRKSIKEIDESNIPIRRESLSERRGSSSSSSRSSVAKEDSSISRLARIFETRPRNDDGRVHSETNGYENTNRLARKDKIDNAGKESAATSLILADVMQEDSIEYLITQSNDANSETTSLPDKHNDNVISYKNFSKQGSNIEIKVTQHTADSREQQITEIKKKSEKPKSDTLHSHLDGESVSKSLVGINDISCGTNSVFEDTTIDISACTDLIELENHNIAPTETAQVEAPHCDYKKINNDEDDAKIEISVPFIDEDATDNRVMKVSSIDQSVIAELSEEIKEMNDKLKSKRTAVSEVTKSANHISHSAQATHSTRVETKPKTVKSVTKTVTKTVTVHEKFTSSSLQRGSKNVISTTSRAKSYADQIKQRPSVKKTETKGTIDKSTSRVGMLMKSRRTLSNTSLNESKMFIKQVPTPAAKPTQNSTGNEKSETSSIKQTISTINRLATPKSASARADAVRRSMRASNDHRLSNSPSARKPIKKSSSLQDVHQKSTFISKDQPGKNIAPKNSGTFVTISKSAVNKLASSAPSTARAKSDKLVSRTSKEKQSRPSTIERTESQSRRVDSKSTSSIHSPRNRTIVNVRASMAATPTGRTFDSSRKSSSLLQSPSTTKQNSKETKKVGTNNILRSKIENKPTERPRISCERKSASNQSINGIKESTSKRDTCNTVTKKTPAVIKSTSDIKNDKISTLSNSKCKITSKSSVTRDSKSSMQTTKQGSLSARSSTRRGPLAQPSGNTPRAKTSVASRLQDQRSVSSSNLSRTRSTSSEEIEQPFVPLNSSISSRSTSSLAMRSKPKSSAAKPQKSQCRRYTESNPLIRKITNSKDNIFQGIISL